MRAIILGAGPTGLGAAWAFERAGAEWMVLEREDRPGGLAASYCRDGFTWDIGGHILFSHYSFFDHVLEEVVPPNEWYVHRRQSFIRIRDAWVPYPLQHHMRFLPQEDQRRCIQGVLELAEKRRVEPAADFEDWIYRTMGKGLADLFMIPYNKKTWVVSPKRMSAKWVGDRVAVPDLARMLQHPDDRAADAEWGLNSRFRFPKSGGMGSVWRHVADSLPPERMSFGAPAVKVDAERRVVLSGSGREYHYDVLISTMPVDQLVRLAGLGAFAVSAGRLERTRTWVGGIGIKGEMPPAAQGRCWMYFPEAEYPFYRVTVLSHYSPQNVPQGCYSLMVEVASRPGDALADDRQLLGDSVRALKQCGLIESGVDPVHTWTYLADYGYPVPTLERDVILESLLPGLERLGIYSRGRFGAWKYEVGNMDHCFMQGVEVARRVLTGSGEETLCHPERINGSGKA